MNGGASDNILKDIPGVSFNMLITLQMVETQALQHLGVSNVPVRLLKSSGLVQRGDRPE